MRANDWLQTLPESSSGSMPAWAGAEAGLPSIDLYLFEDQAGVAGRGCGRRLVGGKVMRDACMRVYGLRGARSGAGLEDER